MSSELWVVGSGQWAVGTEWVSRSKQLGAFASEVTIAYLYTSTPSPNPHPFTPTHPSRPPPQFVFYLIKTVSCFLCATFCFQLEWQQLNGQARVISQ